jgi:hypothetical protein
MEEINIKLYLGRPDSKELEESNYIDPRDFLEMCEILFSVWEDKVYLIAAEQTEFDQTFIDHDFSRCMIYIKNSLLDQHYDADGGFDVIPMSIWVYVYPSYEEAYKVALSMKEPTGLAYT